MTEKLDVPGSNRKHKFITRFFSDYYRIYKGYWWIIISIGLFFGWLLSFPMRGPLLSILIEKYHLDFILISSLFLIGHVAGLLSGGAVGYFVHRYLDWFASGAIVCQVITLLLPVSVTDTFPVLFTLLGYFSGLATLSWVTRFATTVPFEYRSRTFILGAVLANLIYYIVAFLLNQGLSFSLIYSIIALLPIAMPFLLLKNQHVDAAVNSPKDRLLSPPSQPEDRPNVFLNTFILIVFILLIYTVAGIMYYFLANRIFYPSGMLKYFGLIPYIVFLVLAGNIGDYYSRKNNAITGSLLIGLGFLLTGLFHESLQYIVFQTMLLGGYAFLDTFTWVIGADLFTKRSIYTGYSLILSANILAILAGILLGNQVHITFNNYNYDTLMAVISAILCFIAIFFTYGLKETRRISFETSATVSPKISLEELMQSYKFTPRELEIVKLLLTGASLESIREALIISPDTLKTHLRNIYRKAGVRNRLEFTVKIMKDGGGEVTGHSDSFVSEK